MTITKAVVPAAGFGTRMLPAAKAVPKEMLPVLNRPTIEYVAQEATDAGIGELLLIVSNDKKAVEDHFDTHAELERRLAEKNRTDWLASTAAVMAKARVFSVRQREQLGLGHAVLQAQAFVGDEAFLCMLGDTIFSGGQPPAMELVARHAELAEKHGRCSVIGLERVPAEKVGRYGIVGGEDVGGTLRIDRLVEKPSPAEAPSDLAIAARYLLSPTIFACLHDTEPGKGGEIQLTDALIDLAAREPVFGVPLASARHDIGNPTDWLKTNLAFAARDEALWAELSPMLRELLR
jgi:UTP--glucose-1-phosphate uridylyltransferase